MKHIIHKHDSYAIVRPNAAGVKYICVFTNGDSLRDAYRINNDDGTELPFVEGYDTEEIQVLYDNFTHRKT